MASRPLPSFYKILLNRSAPHLELPPGFVRKYLQHKIPENPILRSRNGGYSWRLKIKKYGEIYCFADGWSDVVEDSELGFGDFLVFWLVDESTFKLSIFSPNGCERDFPSQIQPEHHHIHEQEEEEEEAIVAAEKEEEEDDNDDEEEAEEDDEEEEEEEEESDEEEEEEEDDAIYDDDGGEEEEEEDDDGGGDVDVDGDDGDPFFMTIISKGHTMSMRLPSEFARLAGIDAERSVIMKNIEGDEWKIRLLSDSKRYYLSGGWSEFQRGNELCEGDKCVFKFIKSEDKLCLAKVTKKRVQSKQPPAVEVSKKRSGRQPPRVVVESTDDGGREVVRPEQSISKAQAPAAEVLKSRLRRKPPLPRKDDGRAKQPAGKVPAAAEVSKRSRGRPPRVEEKVRSKKQKPAPAAEVSKRLRGRPPRVEEKAAGKAPAAEVLKRKRGRPLRVEVESKDGGAKRSRGRPTKRKSDS